jgi:hypothetical protein
VSLISFPIPENYIGSKSAVFWDIFMAVTMKNVIFWDMMLCVIVKDRLSYIVSCMGRLLNGIFFLAMAQL